MIGGLASSKSNRGDLGTPERPLGLPWTTLEPTLLSCVRLRGPVQVRQCTDRRHQVLQDDRRRWWGVPPLQLFIHGW